jgi:DNA transposition AAA+ family ATPase
MSEIPSNKKDSQSDIERLFINYIFSNRQLRLLYEWLDLQRQSRHINLTIDESSTVKSTACQIDSQSDIERLFINYIFSNRQLRLLYEWLDLQRQSRHNNLIIGEPSTGKSIACQIYAYKNKIQHLKNTSPIVYIDPPFCAGAKDIFLAIIQSLDSANTDLHLAALREKVRCLLKDCGVEMLIIDDTVHYSNKVFTDIISICEPMNIAVILVGTQCLYSYIYGNMHLNPRFNNIYRFGHSLIEATKPIITFY